MSFTTGSAFAAGSAGIFKPTSQVTAESGRFGAIDDPMVERNGEGQEESGHEGLTVPEGLDGGPGEAKDGGLRQAYQGRECGAADAAQAGDGERGPPQFLGGQRALAGAGTEPG